MDVRTQGPTELFEGGPPVRILRLLGLIKPDRPIIGKRAGLCIAISWVPLALLALVQGMTQQDAAAFSFFSDFAAFARFIVAVPILIYAETDCIPRLCRIANHFLEGGFVRDSDVSLYDRAVRSTRRLMESRLAEIATFILAYAAALTLVRYVPLTDLPDWYPSGREFPSISPAGWWHGLVSMPLLLALLFGWFWRALLWARFLWLMARLDLRLVPSHPDLYGGLHFVGTSLRAFRLLAFAFGTIVAGTMGNRVIHEGGSLLEIRNVAIGLGVFVLALFVSPLLVFLRKLPETKRRAEFEYGRIAGEVGREFEKKWMKSSHRVDEGALQAEDFSATTDLYELVSRVYQAKVLPFGSREVGFLILAAVLPLAPVALSLVPLGEILNHAAKFLL
jgi:hypothetical protein